MKITSWNVNSVRARIVNIIDYIKLSKPDILMLQEIKTENKNFPLDDFKKQGYDSYIFGQKSYNGVAFLSKVKLSNINTKFIKEHIKDGNIPVIAPLGIDDEGNSYNINADTAAGFIAGELEASKLLLLTDVPGILDQDKKLISSLTLDDASKIIDEDFIVGGMKPKILTCVEAMKKGVNKTTILDGRIPHSVVLELFTEHGIGTQIYS